MKLCLFLFASFALSSLCINATDSVAYGLGSNGGYFLSPTMAKDYKTPTIVPHLPMENVPYYSDHKVNGTIEEIPTTEAYYDGEAKLNVAKLNCDFQKDINACLHMNGCGWCGERGVCVTGTIMGPTQPCARSTYVFTSPGMVQNVIQHVDGGTSMTIVNN